MQLIPVATKIAILQPNIGVGQGLIPSSGIGYGKFSGQQIVTQIKPV